MQTRPSRTSGFTILELLIVIVVIAILAAITLVAYNGVRNRALAAELQSGLNGSSNILANSRTTSANDTYPSSTSGLNLPSSDSITYTYTTTGTTYCLTATSNANTSLSYYITQDGGLTSGTCPSSGSGSPSTTETAPVASGASTTIGGYTGIEPSSCPSVGGSWVKVPGNSLYGFSNGFCVQQYPASNVSNVATSQPAGPRWTAITQTAAASDAASITSGAHLISEGEWMTIASNAAMQPTNWSGGSVGSGTLPTGSATATYGGASVTLSNGSVVYFDTGSTSYYASNEWTCYTGTNASNCGLAQQYQPQPANAFYPSSYGSITNFGSFATNASGYFYGDPRYANTSLGSYINSSNAAGLGYLRVSYAAGSSTVYAFERGNWNGSTASGIFALYVYTTQSYAHAIYGFRAAY